MEWDSGDVRMEYAQSLVPSVVAALVASDASREDAEGVAATMVERFWRSA